MWICKKIGFCEAHAAPESLGDHLCPRRKFKIKKRKTKTADFQTILKFIEKHEIRDERLDSVTNALKSLHPTSVNL